ncbi:hypothetical protein WJX73_007713 [Symbiochloris irregularis]|uniref:Beta-hexosaminidase n=1 Tax=Symbiochloris irregularis TaxID=706552 RepID=A0AAW1NZL2_9CHLO
MLLSSRGLLIVFAACVHGALAGSVWPKPLNQTSSHKVLLLNPDTFYFEAREYDSSVLQDAFARYYTLIFSSPGYQPTGSQAGERLRSARHEIKRLDVYVHSNDQSLNLNTPESYELTVAAPHSTIEAATVGLLLDTSRHFLPVLIIKDTLDAMAWAKLNVFHWHIVDDQSFPFVSERLPLLSLFGAFSPEHVYTPDDVRDVVAFARARGIRVVPEFDTPGHTLAWGKGYPDLLVDCCDAQGQPTGAKGPMNPARNGTYTLLWSLLREVVERFPDAYLHLGGDEVPFDCWQSNPEVRDWMASAGVADMAALEQRFEERVLGLAAAAGRAYIVWQDVLDNGVQVRDDTVVHVWKWWWPVADGEGQPSTGEAAQCRNGVPAGACELSKGCCPASGMAANDVPGWTHEMARVTQQGYKTLLSSPWYLNLGEMASEDWATFYQVEPLGFEGTREQHSQVMGGEACVWGEYVDATNVISRTWPRAAAVAERLWSDASVRDLDQARARLSQHRCRMLARGLNAEPLGPGFCPGDDLLEV